MRQGYFGSRLTARPLSGRAARPARGDSHTEPVFLEHASLDELQNFGEILGAAGVECQGRQVFRGHNAGFDAFDGCVNQ